MKDILIKVFGVIGTIAFATLWLNTCHNLKGDIKDLTAENVQWSADYDSCKNAKVYTTEDVDTTDHILDVVTVPVPYEVIRYDTVWMDSVVYLLPVNHYEDTLFTDDFALFWKAEGRIDKIEFPYYRLYDKTVIESNVIEKVRTVYSYKERSHLFVDFSMNTHDFKSFSGVRVGLDYINRHGWGLTTGWLYIEQKSYFDVGVKFRLL